MLHSRDRFRQWLPALFDGEFQWDFLKPAFNGTKIMPMDFDAVIERHGHVLIFETKTDGKDIEQGQRITLTDQWRKGATIFVVRGKTAETITGIACYWEGAHRNGQNVGDLPLKNCKWDDVLYQTRRWFCRASVPPLPSPSREEWDIELWRWDYDRTTTNEHIVAKSRG